MIEIVINGETRAVPPETSLPELLQILELAGDRVAIELNREIVRRDRWPQVRLRDQDRLEIVQFVGGG